MIRIKVRQDCRGELLGFSTAGHAGYAEAGEDIVCAAVSALVLNTVNSVEKLTENPFSAEQNQKTGEIRFRFTEAPDASGELLLRSMVLGLEQIQEEYGAEYLRLQFEEV